MKEKSIPGFSHFAAFLAFKASVDWTKNLPAVAEFLVSELNLQVVKKYDYAYKSYGQTRVLLLKQSHLAIHSWPEYGLIHLDLVSCAGLTKTQFRQAIIKLSDKLKLVSYKIEKD